MDNEKIAFRCIRFMHETLYGWFCDARRTLREAGLAPEMCVLEVGCGPGFFTLPAAEIVGEHGHVCAIDLNQYAVDHVEAKVAHAGVRNVRVMQLNAADTTFEDGRFDLAFLFGFRRAIGGMEPVLREMHRVIRPGGTLVTEGPLVDEQSSLFRLVDRKGRSFRYRCL